jgi:hypothetical protein
VPTATPDTLVETLAQFVTAAAEQAANEPGRIAQVLDDALTQAGQDVARLPADLLQQLRDAVDPPDWFSLLVFVLLALSKLDEDHLSVGALAATDGWSRAVALTYHTSDDADAPSATVALALTDPGTTHGVIFRVAGLDQATFGKDKVSVSITGQGTGEWRIPFGGGVRAPQTAASLRCTLGYGPVLPLDADTRLGVGIGSARITVALSNEAPVWHVDAAMGDEQGAAGVEARADFADALGPLSGVLQSQPVGERYSPSLSMGAGAAPAFTLGHQG